MNFPNKADETPLIIAARHDDDCKDICDLLLHHGADPNARNRYDNTALKEAVLYGQTEVATFLLEHGAKPGFSTIKYAISNKEPRILKLLLDYGQHQNLRFPLPIVFSLAISVINEDCAMITLEQGYYPKKEVINDPCVSVFHQSAKYGCVKVMNILVELNPQFQQVDWLIQKQFPWALSFMHQDYIS